MTKLGKFLIFIIVLLLIAGGVFYWKNQQEVADLNRELPDGVRVVKTLFGDYVVVNKIDGYQFKIPEEWGGVKKIYYTQERIEKDYNLSSFELEGNKGASRIGVINRFVIQELDLDLKFWAELNFQKFGLVGDFNKDKIDSFEIIKVKEDVHLIGMYVYFFKKDSSIYTITNGSEEFIREIIINGKW